MNWACPCGDPHSDKPEVHAFLAGLLQSGLPECLDFLVAGNGNGGWKVPRAWIAFHGLHGAEAAALADKYGWQKIKG